MNRSVLRIAAAGLLLCSGAASAGFIGQTVGAEWLYPDATTSFEGPLTAVVAGGQTIEFPTGFARITGDSYDFKDAQITIMQDVGGFNGGSFNGVRFFDALNTIADITNVAINSGLTSYPGFDASRISFDANDIYLNFAGLTEPGKLVLQVAFGSSPLAAPLSTVPEPATLVLLGAGLAGLAASRRRKQ